MNDESICRDVCIQVLDHLGVGVLACDSHQIVRTATVQGRVLAGRLLGRPPIRLGDRLIPPLTADLAVPGGDSVNRSRRLTSRGGRIAMYVNALRASLPGLDCIYTLRPERVRDAEALEPVRERFGLSSRDLEIVQCIRRGLSNRQIGAELRLTEGTIKNYVHRIFGEIGVHSRAELIALVERVRRDE